MIQKQPLLGLTLPELQEIVKQLSMPAFTAKQIASWLYDKKVKSIDEMTNLSLKHRSLLNEIYEVGAHAPVEAMRSIDGTIKYLYQVGENHFVEAVYIPDGERATLCVSSQVGCKMNCKFCMTGKQGFAINLSANQILNQIISLPECNQLTNVVMMGMGEPLDNYDNVMRFLEIVGSRDSLNIGYRHISLSTCGLVDKIDRLANENYPITLSISLHACCDEDRSRIMPINNAWNIDKLLDACKRYFDKTGRRISFEYTLISGENDSVEQAKKLAHLIKKYFGSRPVHVNLIPLNHVDERQFSAGSREDVKRFCDTLNALHVNATVRRRLGPDIDASCGQLRHKASANK